jgi:hypothetical protein
MTWKNQIFRFNPPTEVCNQVLECFGRVSIEDSRPFSRKDLEKLNTVEKIEELVPTLLKYYLPCKGRCYLSDLNYKNVITVLRHIVRIQEGKVSSKEKYVKGEKYIIYSIHGENADSVPKNNFYKTKPQSGCLVSFD